MPSSWPAWPLSIPSCCLRSSIAARERQQDLNLIQARATLVRARTMIVNALRGLVKSAGGRLPGLFSRSRFADTRRSRHSAGRWPKLPSAARADRPAQRADRTAWIADRKAGQAVSGDRHAAHRARGGAVGGRRLRAHAGPAASAGRPSRSAGAFLGLRPRQSQSGDSDPQRRITKTGNSYLRSCWCSRRNTSWAASVPTRRCAAGA